MYANRNFKTKKELKDAIRKGASVGIFAPGLGNPVQNGDEYICGPHAPEPHKWYAKVRMENGVIVKVLS